jgi:predicted lipoprotein
MKALADALNKNDLDAAKTAFARIEKAAARWSNRLPATAAIPSAVGALNDAMASLKSALNEGDLDAAKAAFASVMADRAALHKNSAVPKPSPAEAETLADPASAGLSIAV